MITRLFVACLFTAATSINGATAADDDESAAAQYAKNCSVCHGDSGDGNSHAAAGLKPPPRDFTDPALASQMTDERMTIAIRDGRPGTAMVAWGSVLDSTEISALVSYIAQNFISGSEPINDQGAVVYQENCSVCHGDEGSGAIWGQESLSRAPRNFRTAESQRELSRKRMIAAVTHGLSGTPMPGFGTQLSSTQIDSVVEYIRREFMQVGVFTDAAVGAVVLPLSNRDMDAPTDHHTLGIPNELTGNVASGRAAYMANCVPCHGSAGNGNGPRAYFIFPKPRNFLDPATQRRLNRPALFYGIKNGVIGKEMPAWGKVMSDQEIADIAEFVYREFVSGN